MGARVRELVGLALAVGIVGVLVFQWRILHRQPKEVPAPPPVVVTSRLSPRVTDFRQLVEKLRGADKVLLWEGLPHQVSEEESFEEERHAKKNFELRGFHFYTEPLTLNTADGERLMTLIRDENTVQDWKDGKLCGEFHPDYALEYQVGDSHYHLFVCLGCYELRLFGPANAAMVDLRNTAHDEWKKLLSPQRKNRPQNTQQLIGQAVDELGSTDRKSARPSRIAKVTAGTPKVIGAMEQAMIEHAIRSHLDTVKGCYEAELAETPTLAGRVVIQITVTASGQVAASVVQSSTLNNADVERCIAIEARKWKFPRPSSSGIVVISSLFTLKSDPS